MKNVYRKLTFGVFLTTVMCVALSDDFYYDGIKDFRRYSKLVGVISAIPEHKWPIVFAALAYPLATISLLIIMIAVFRKLLPRTTRQHVMELVFKRYSLFCLASAGLLLHYISCDFTGDRWYLMRCMYKLCPVEVWKVLYDKLHQIVPWLYCNMILLFAVAHKLFEERADTICVGLLSVLLLVVGLFFSVFDLWFQPWAVFPIVVSIAVTSSAVAWISLLSRKER